MHEMMWLRVDLDDGMFPHERAVSFQNADGESVSLFVHDERVEVKGSRILVRVLEFNDRLGLIELPAQNMSGSSVVRVQRSALEK